VKPIRYIYTVNKMPLSMDFLFHVMDRLFEITQMIFACLKHNYLSMVSEKTFVINTSILFYQKKYKLNYTKKNVYVE